jgi:nucleoside-diphosphate kinase
MSYTIALIKPDAVQRRLVGLIISRVEETGLGIVAMKMLHSSGWNAKAFYSRQHFGKPYYRDLCTFMLAGDSFGLVLSGTDAIMTWRDKMGSFNTRAEGTIRGDFMLKDARPMENLVHGSDSLESYAYEYNVLFGQPVKLGDVSRCVCNHFHLLTNELQEGIENTRTERCAQCGCLHFVAGELVRK